MNNYKTRQLLLSIAITSLMLSTTLLYQGASATSAGGTIQKSITMTAGADGRAFAAVDGTWSLPSIQKVEYDHPFSIYSIAYSATSPGTTTTYNLPGPKIESPPSAYNPSWYNGYSSSLGPGFYIPKFLMTRNTTNDIVSPTFTLSARNNITLGTGTTEFQVDALNPVVVTSGVPAEMVGTLSVLTGLVIGGSVSMYVLDPLGNFGGPVSLPTGYFAIPNVVYAAGYYMMYFTSTTGSYVKLTPTSISPTSLTIGQFASGEMKIPEQLTQDALISGDVEPSQIVAISYDVSKGDEYAFSLTVNEFLAGPPGPSSSSYVCLYFDVGTGSNGIGRYGTLAVGQPIVSKAVVSGKVYVVLVGNYISRFQYSTGVESATVPTASLNTPWLLSLPTPSGMYSQLYHFSIPTESMVKMNYTNLAGGTMSAEIFKVTPTGTVYTTGSSSLGSGYFRLGNALSSYLYTLYMGIGDYMVNFIATSGTPSANVEINTYPIVNYTSGTSFDLTVGTTKALAIDIPSAFEFNTFNVTLLSQLNASMNYRMTLFDDYNRYLNTYFADGLTGSRGLGNRESSGTWQGVSAANYYVEPSGQKWFQGNKTSQQCQFVSTYVGRYFLMVDFLYGYNTTTTGASAPTRWNFYRDLTVSLKIDRSPPPSGLAWPNVYEYRYLTLDSSAGTGSTSTTFTGAGHTQRIIGLKLTPRINSWTRISISILNGTANQYEYLFDRVRYQGQRTFDYTELLGLWPVFKQVTNVYTYYNTTYNIEFGTIASAMMVEFYIELPAGAAHSVVTFNVNHFNTPGVSGVTPPTGPPPVSAPPFEVIILAVVAVVVVVALVGIFVYMRKKK